MPIRFTIEQRHLTDAEGRAIAMPGEVSYHTCDAETIDQAVQSFVREDAAEIIGNVLKFPGFQAVLTVRNPKGVYTLQFTPASQRNLRWT